MPMKEYDVLVIGDANVDLLLRGEDLAPDFGQAEKLVEDANIELEGYTGVSALGMRVWCSGNDSIGRHWRPADKRGSRKISLKPDNNMISIFHQVAVD